MIAPLGPRAILPAPPLSGAPLTAFHAAAVAGGAVYEWGQRAYLLEVSDAQRVVAALAGAGYAVPLAPKIEAALALRARFCALMSLEEPAGPRGYDGMPDFIGRRPQWLSDPRPGEATTLDRAQAAKVLGAARRPVTRTEWLRGALKAVMANGVLPRDRALLAGLAVRLAFLAAFPPGEEAFAVRLLARYAGTVGTPPEGPDHGSSADGRAYEAV